MERRQASADPQTRPNDPGCESACRLPEATPTQRCCKYQVAYQRHKYKYKYLKLNVKYNLSTPVLEHIKCQTECKPLMTQNISKIQNIHNFKFHICSLNSKHKCVNCQTLRHKIMHNVRILENTVLGTRRQVPHSRVQAQVLSTASLHPPSPYIIITQSDSHRG